MKKMDENNVTEEVGNGAPDTVVNVPLDVLAAIVSSAQGLGNAVEQLSSLAAPWAVIYRKTLSAPGDEHRSDVHAVGFNERENLDKWVAVNYYQEDIDVLAFLRDGKRAKVTVEIKTKLG
jgi:hypothetical protein